MKSTIVALVIVGLLFFLLVFFLYRELHNRKMLAKKNMSFIESINLTGLPIISFHNKNSVVNMVLDTGSNVCLINQSYIEALECKKEDDVHDGVLGLGGEADKGLIVTVPFSYKNQKFEIECWVTNMQSTVDTMKQEYGVTIHGILGTGFFMKYKYVLDFNEMVAYSLKKN